MSTIISLAGIISLPLGLILVTKLIRNFNKTQALQSEEFEQKFSELVQEDTSSGMIGVYWKVIQLVRWSITLIIMVYCRDYYAIQIQVLLFISVGT